MKFLKKLKKSIHKRVSKLKENYRFQVLKRAKFTNLNLLSKDIPNLNTIEIYPQNDFYYHAYNLKKFCNLEDYQLKCAIEHGCYNSKFFWHCDIENNMPVILSMGEYRKNILHKVCNKKHYAIGPFIAYINHSLREIELEKEKRRLKKNLLVFPMHSSHYIDVTYNINEFCEEIKRIKNENNFNSVRVCMYWKDIINNYHKLYKEYGFECVTAGHIFDQNFTPRIKSLIETSTMTMSNRMGTHVGYCIYMNKPHYIFRQKANWFVDDYVKDIKEELDETKTKNNDIIEQENTFSKYSETITQVQRELIEKYFSISKIRTKEELLKIFEEAEELYYEGIRK